MFSFMRLALLGAEVFDPDLPEGWTVKGHGECTPFTTYCQFRGIAAVGIAMAVFIGLPVFILATNVGWRKAGAIGAAVFFGYLAVHGFVWLFFPRGPIVAHQVAGLPMAISQRMPAFLLMIPSLVLMLLFCLVLNRMDRPREEETLLRE